MSKGVSKQCSIMNYLRKVDSNLHELLQDLCLGKMLGPRKGSPGITFLRPDKALFKEIQTMAAGDSPEDAVAALQSLVILDYISDLGEFEEKKSDIPTYLRKKLQIKSVDEKKVTLQNGAEITVDKDFEARGDRNNINVFIISKALAPTDGPDADFSNAKVKSKKGGADLSSVLNRTKLFEKIVEEFCTTERDPAMEFLWALIKWSESKVREFQNNPEEQRKYHPIFRRKISGDSLASLAIILQPYKTSEHNYVSNEVLRDFIDQNNLNTLYTTNVTYSMDSKAKQWYETICNGDQNDFFAEVQKLVEASKSLSAQFSKLNAVKLLSNFYNNIQSGNGISGVVEPNADTKNNANPFPSLDWSGRPTPKPTAKTLFAEAELRVMSAILLENCQGVYLYDELINLYRNCSLDAPYMCADVDLVKSCNLGFYYSTVYLIARSDALFYVPCADGAPDISKDDNITSDDTFININQTVLKILEGKRKASETLIQTLVDNVTGTNQVLY